MRTESGGESGTSWIPISGPRNCSDCPAIPGNAVARTSSII